MSNNTKYFLDFSGLQRLWTKIKNTFVDKTELQTIVNNINNIESITLMYAPKLAINYSEALKIAKKNTTAPGSIIIVGEDETINNILYKEGFYIVNTEPEKTLYYIGTSNGNISNEELLQLQQKILELEQTIIKSIDIVDENGNKLNSSTIINNSLILVRDDKVVANSNSINALTHRAIAAKFGDIENKISSIPKFNIEIVNELPTTISFSTIYLLKNNSTEDNNIYTEYIYVQDLVNGNHWEVLGSQNLVLDNYVTQDFLTELLQTELSSYVKKTEVEPLIQSIKDEIVSTITIDIEQAIEDIEQNVVNNVSETLSETYATKDEILTEEDIIISITEGNIGNNIKISIDQIEKLI